MNARRHVFLQLAKTFDQKVFSKIPHKCTEVINLAPSMAEQMENAVTCEIRARCAIILIVALDLERIVHTFTSGQGSGRKPIIYSRQLLKSRQFYRKRQIPLNLEQLSSHGLRFYPWQSL